MHILAAVLSLCWSVAGASTNGVEWCYTGCVLTPDHWKDIENSFCGGNSQSPIDIVPSQVKTNAQLGNFSFANFSNRDVFKSIENTGDTAKVHLMKDAVEFHGGGLKGTYTALQFHFHWGDTEHHPGSEHLIQGKRFTMEMHVVSVKKGYTLEQATADPEGVAVLGFLIEAMDNINKSEHWGKLTSHLNSSKVTMDLKEAISMNDLIGNVDLTKFYRYKGSLTTPMCNEVVLWTVFAEPVYVHADLLQHFPTKTKLSNVYRPKQELGGRVVHASPAVQLPPAHWCYSDVSHQHGCDYSPDHWGNLDNSFCSGSRQSPLDISSKDAMVNNYLDDFHFKNFDDKHVIELVINTGHTVKCMLKENLVEVSGGGLGHVYVALQFHFHWGDSSSNSGSEHQVDSTRFPMEMHIVTKRKDLTLDEAVKKGNGLAVLAFFIEAPGTKSSGGGGGEEPSTPDEPSPSSKEAWKLLTNYLSKIPHTGNNMTFSEKVSIDDLLGDVDRGSYYRYNGSLTTPSCNEAVVWTVFKHAVQVDHSLMKLFPTKMGYHNVYRPTQKLHNRTVYTSAASGVHQYTLLLLLLSSAQLMFC
ncbi:unnamed protein product [Knipowitschia caucasica]